MSAPRTEVERTGLALSLGVAFSVLFHAALFSPELTHWMRSPSASEKVDAARADHV
ncbi:MAG: hypothetical protein JNK53_06975, partial [Phycisphaerae bacterium]|nr:hypothetical protein [Phycisphaerae bacterium]